MSREDFAFPITGNPSRAAAITGPVTDLAQLFISMMAGAGNPDDANVRVFGATWVNTTTGEIMQCIDLSPRTDAALGAAGKRWDMHEAEHTFNGITATVTQPIWIPHDTVFALELVVSSDTATSGSDASNRYQFQITNASASNNLLATAWGTDGTGGGAEFAVKTPQVITFDQNRNLSANQHLDLVITKTGSPTSWNSAKVKCILRAYLRSV